MRWLKPFVATEQPLETINRWLDLLYYVTLIVLAFQGDLTLNVAILLVSLALVHFINRTLSRRNGQPFYLVYPLMGLEFILLIALYYGTHGEKSSTIFVVYTAFVMLNYPGYVALPFIGAGYLLYLFFVDQRVVGFNGYVLSLLNFSPTPLSLLVIRLLVTQRQRILDLNQRIQSQAELTAEMSKLRERNSLAEAMHDTLGHTLTSSIVSLEGATLLLANRPTEAIALLESVREQLQTSLGDIRQTVRTLKTDILADHTTLHESLRHLVERVSRQTSIAIALEDQLAVDLLPIQAYVLYNVVRESITNALKHGQATHIQITLAEVAGNCIALTVGDNGQGAGSFVPGFGLTHLEQKVQALGGALTVETQEKAGFRIHVLLPLGLDVALQPHHKTQRKAELYDSDHVGR